MTSDRIQRQVNLLLDQAEAGIAGADWAAVRSSAEKALVLDPQNRDAEALLAAALPGLGEPPRTEGEAPALPGSFAGGRYQVKRFLGEGGKKRVFLCHDTRLDRDVAFALIKTEGLDAEGRERIERGLARTAPAAMRSKISSTASRSTLNRRRILGRASASPISARNSHPSSGGRPLSTRPMTCSRASPKGR